MNLILRPVDPAKRLPDKITGNPMMEGLRASGPVLVTYVNGSVSERFSAHTFAFYLHSEKCWQDAVDGENIFKDKNNMVREWFEEINFESLSPSDDLVYQASKSACGSSVYKMSIYQEGITFFKNQQLKNLRK